MRERQVEIEGLLDLLTIACADLEAVREKIDNDIDRQAVSSQLKAMRSLWRKLNAGRLAQPDPRLDAVAAGLKEVTAELKQAKKRLESVAKVIHAGARAIALAEKALKCLP